jgi:hypothetical protein
LVASANLRVIYFKIKKVDVLIIIAGIGKVLASFLYHIRENEREEHIGEGGVGRLERKKGEGEGAAGKEERRKGIK